MNTITVETTGSFQLLDRHSNILIRPDTPTEVPETAFITERLANGQLRQVDAPVQEQETPDAPETAADAPVQEQEAPKPKKGRGK